MRNTVLELGQLAAAQLGQHKKVRAYETGTIVADGELRVCDQGALDSNKPPQQAAF